MNKEEIKTRLDQNKKDQAKLIESQKKLEQMLLSEDLHYFKMTDDDNVAIHLELLDDTFFISLDNIDNLTASLDFKQATRIYQALGQMLATAKREKI